LRELTLSELETIVSEVGEARYRARQVMHWLWRHQASSLEEMREVPARLRQYLAQNYRLGHLTVSHVAHAADGTRKLLFRLADGAGIEGVIIPTHDRTTLCISSQVGCAMACEFCATARMGLVRNLKASEILGQIIAASTQCTQAERLTNYVFMGMGEPLANYPNLARALTVMTAEWGLAVSPRRITVSTVGLAPVMERLLAEFPVNLAVSLHATSDELRNQLVPINRRYPLAHLLESCRQLPLGHRRRITFEYVMLQGVNDSPADAVRLARLVAPLKCKINLIFFNPFPGAPFQPTPRSRIEEFQAILLSRNLTATIRESRGAEIAAACGQLYAQARMPRSRLTGLNHCPSPSDTRETQPPTLL